MAIELAHIDKDGNTATSERIEQEENTRAMKFKHDIAEMYFILLRCNLNGVTPLKG